MRLKDLFTVPMGQKVTEKHLHRVLISSICSILLCMTCLVSTTWAWFAVSIQNTGNIIEIATVTTNVDVTEDGASVDSQDDGSYALDVGSYNISVGLEQPEKTPAGANLLNDSQCPAYVIMTVSHGKNVEYRLFTFTDRESEQNHQLTVGESPAVVSFSVSWVKPAFDIPDGSEPVVIGEIPTEPATEPATIPSAEPTTEATTNPVTEPSTETTVSPTTEAPTVPSTTEPFTEATTTPATEETTVPSGTESATVPDETSAPPTTDPSSASEETAAPTIIPTETTGPVTEPQGTTTPAETD